MGCQIKVGHFESDDGIVHIPIGFLPDYVRLIGKGAASGSAVIYEWFREMESHDGLGGWIWTPGGADAELASVDGISAYNTRTEVPTIEEWTTLRADNATARSATARGTLIKCTISGVDEYDNPMDRSAIFECIVDGNGGATEPPWPRLVGGQVVEVGAGTTEWERVNATRAAVGYQGFSLAASMTGLGDGHEGYFLAIGTGGNVVDFGDVALWPSGIEGG